MACTTHGRPHDVLEAIKIGEIYAEIHEAELRAIAKTTSQILDEDGLVTTSEFNRSHSMVYIMGGQKQLDYLVGLYDRFVQHHMTYTIITITPISTAFDDIRDAMAAGDATRTRRRT